MTDSTTGPTPGEDLAAQSAATSEEVAALYDTWASGGDYDRDVDSWGYVAPAQIAEMTTVALARTPGEVLDAGCGTGKVGVELAQRGIHDVVGGDFTPVSVEAARQRGVYTAVDHLDLNQPLRFDDERFAATVSAGVFTYVTDTDATLRELLRIVQPGGSVLFTQRTDLWDERDCDAIVSSLVADGLCSADVSEPLPYLPLHPDFGDKIEIRYVALRRGRLGTGS